jgi:peptidoglycan/xylan/chitin deacetylase (PgdA/CDA1 family)
VIRRAVHRLRRRIDRVVHPGGRGVVLMYHRISDEASDPYALCVTPAQFEEHVRVIRDVGRPTPLDAFAAGLEAGSLSDGAIAITFDDGYLDNLEAAAPVLAKYDVPGLVFVTTGAAGRVREFWWDELERVLLQPGEHAGVLEIEIAGAVRRWELGHDRIYTAEQHERHRGWRLHDESDPTRRHAVFRQLYEVLQPLATELRTHALDGLLAWAGADPACVRPSRRAMRPGDVAALVAGGIMEVGAHTVDHPALPGQPPHIQRGELDRSKRDLEAWTGRAVRGFAYPYGLYDAVSVSAARETGFAYACSGAYRHARPGIDPFLIPRIEVPAMDGRTLGDILRWQLA